MNNKNLKILDAKYGDIQLYGLPDVCPFCHNSITPHFEFCRASYDSHILHVLFSCPSSTCAERFIGYYKYHYGQSTANYSGMTTKGHLKPRYFSDNITRTSEMFVSIYNESYLAEQEGLLNICGVGYRKALEFLIKDFLITELPDDRIAIEKSLLGNCIVSYISNDKIKSAAKRAVWIGNDETHYVRKWEDRDLQDLKQLIDLTVHWIEMELLARQFEQEMPDPKSK